ncbi:MAG: Crp/Fnr family transcriptional regulator [Flavobacteriales bacterium]|jgi:CRP-like cAMP-binding protein|nr:Crp/Fnr family transcriptional regulator [Flavobacteriales bacterium]
MINLFTQIQAISKLSEEAQKALEGISTKIDIAKNEELQAIGNRCKTIYFVNRGLLRIFYLKDGVDVTESFELENSFVARADSLFDAQPSKKGIQALEDTELIAINAVALFKLYEEHRDLERLFRIIIEQAYVQTVQRLESLQFYTAEERYHNLIKNNANLIQRIPLKHIASYLGITQVSLSRIRAKNYPSI